MVARHVSQNAACIIKVVIDLLIIYAQYEWNFDDLDYIYTVLIACADSRVDRSSKKNEKLWDS